MTKTYRAVVTNPKFPSYGWTGDVELSGSLITFFPDGGEQFDVYATHRDSLYIPELDGAWPSYSKMKPRERLQ